MNEGTGLFLLPSNLSQLLVSFCLHRFPHVHNQGEGHPNSSSSMPFVPSPTEPAEDSEAGWQEHRESIPPIDLTSLVLLSRSLSRLVRLSLFPSHLASLTRSLSRPTGSFITLHTRPPIMKGKVIFIQIKSCNPRGLLT